MSANVTSGTCATQTDWRGTPIEVDSLVVYGANFGSHSIMAVEGRVAGFTKATGVRVEVIRRSSGTPWADDKRFVVVGARKLTVVTGLPDSDKPTWSEGIDEAVARRLSWSKS